MPRYHDDPAADAATIAADVIAYGQSRGWSGDIAEVEAVQEVLAKFNIGYTDDMHGNWAYVRGGSHYRGASQGSRVASWGDPDPSVFQVGAKYNTAYGIARVKSINSAGTSTFVILKPTVAGWKWGDTFLAHPDDQTSPSPRTWTKVGGDLLITDSKEPSMNLRQDVAKLANDHPKLRATLVPLLRTSAGEPKKPKLKLVGQDGNAFMILGLAMRAARKAGWSPAQIKAYQDEATAGDYNHLLAVTMEHFDVS